MAAKTNQDYTLSTQEFLDIMGAIKELPRIYGHIEKIEGHIEKMTEGNTRELTMVRDNIGDVEAIAKAAMEMARDNMRRLDNIDANDANNRPLASSDNGTVNAKELLNFLVKVVTVAGTFGSILYLIAQEIVK